MKNQHFTTDLEIIAEEAWQNDKYEDTIQEANQVLNLVKQYHENGEISQNDTIKVFITRRPAKV